MDFWETVLSGVLGTLGATSITGLVAWAYTHKEQAIRNKWLLILSVLMALILIILAVVVFLSGRTYQKRSEYEPVTTTTTVRNGEKSLLVSVVCGAVAPDPDQPDIPLSLLAGNKEDSMKLIASTQGTQRISIFGVVLPNQFYRVELPERRANQAGCSAFGIRL